MYQNALEKLPNVEFCLLGYDSQVPTSLCLSMRSMGIETVANQERLIINYCPTSYLILDHYFTQGHKAISLLEQDPMRFQVEKKYPVGPCEAQISNKNFRDSQRIKILALDLTPPENEEMNKKSFLSSWQENLAFYEELYKLVESFPQVDVLVKGKDSSAENIEYYKDFFKKIESEPRMNFSFKAGDLDPYKAASETDICLAIHTSLGEEMLSAGVPVLFYSLLGYPGVCISIRRIRYFFY